MNHVKRNINESFKSSGDTAVGESARERHTRDLWERTRKLEEGLRRYHTETSSGHTNLRYPAIEQLSPYAVLRHLSNARRERTSDEGARLVGCKLSKFKLADYQLSWMLASIEFFSLRGELATAEELMSSLIKEIQSFSLSGPLTLQFTWSHLLDCLDVNANACVGPFAARNRLLARMQTAVMERAIAIMHASENSKHAATMAVLILHDTAKLISAVGLQSFKLLEHAIRRHNSKIAIQNTIANTDYFGIVARSCERYMRRVGQNQSDVTAIRRAAKNLALLVCSSFAEECWPAPSASYIRIGLGDQYKRKIVDENLSSLGYRQKGRGASLEPNRSVFEQMFPGVTES